jgi:hypothetical protein
MTDTEITHAIKLFSKGQIRRFPFNGTTLQQLRGEVQNILQISDFVVKYEDDEGDFVTIGSDSELAYAFQLTGAHPLRLNIVQKDNTKSVEETQPPVATPSTPVDKNWKELKKEAKLHKLQFKQEKLQWKQDMKAAKVAMKEEVKQQKSLYVARFVRHVTVEDGYEFAGSTAFNKTWRFRNEGTVAWPDQTVLLCVGKKCDQLGAVTDSVKLNRSVLPGEEVDVSVAMTAPSAAGTYTGFWRLADPSGRKFGPRVRVQIKVVDSSSDEGESSSSSYGDLITQLESMGFNNKALNVRLLMRFNGDLDTVVRRLLRRQQKQAVANNKPNVQ